jgi:hypothetical protein
VIRFWRRRRRRFGVHLYGQRVGRVLGVQTDPDGRWRLQVRIDSDELWRRLTGEYRPWRLRLVNLVRWLLRRPPVPYPRRGPGLRGFSVGGVPRQQGLDELREWYGRHLNATTREGPLCPPETCRVPEAMAERAKPKDGR